MSEPYLVGEAMTGGYGNGPDILHDCTVSVEPGEIAVIVGPNGAGKSTAMKAIFGMLRLSKGTVSINGENMEKLKPQERVLKGMGFVPQNNNVFTSMTVEENLEMGFRFDGIGSNDNIMISLVDMLLNNGKAGLIDINLMQKQDVLSAGSTILEYKDYSIHNLFGKPKKDQKLEDVENLLLKQIELLKKGEFEDWLIKAVVNDYKTKIIESYGSNRFRTMQMMKSFICLLYTSPSPRDATLSRMPSSA